jgi:hypothetical protein
MQSLVIEGYASLFRVDDLAGDVVQANAFALDAAAGRRRRHAAQSCRSKNGRTLDDNAGGRTWPVRAREGVR